MNHSAHRNGLIISVLLINALSSCDEKDVEHPPNILFCISDDQTWLHAGAYGDDIVSTPNFDRIAGEGILFTNAFASVPACAPSRASVLTGRNFYELEQAACHFSFFPAKFQVYTKILEDNGYDVGFTGKGWAPGNWEKGGRVRNPAGPEYNEIRHETIEGISDIDYAENFKAFYKQKGEKPFCFWYGGMEAHRGYPTGKGFESGMDIDEVDVPSFLPNTDKVKKDMLDYYYEIEWFDAQLGKIIDFLKEKGDYENTLIVVTSDNGMPFPRAKSNLYEYGIHMPLAIGWKNRIIAPGKSDALVSFIDFAPTFLDAAGIEIPGEMSGKSLMPILANEKRGTDEKREFIVAGKELHAWCHPDGRICPFRAIRTDRYVYILNLKPDMWPAGHPDPEYSWDFLPYGDIDWGPAKEEVMDTVDHGIRFRELCMGKRPREELYDVSSDPYNLNNLAGDPQYAEIKTQLKEKLTGYLKETGDPRILGKPEVFDNAPYYFSHGLETAGLRPGEWEKLSPGEQKQKTEEAKELMKRKLEAMRTAVFE